MKTRKLTPLSLLALLPFAVCADTYNDARGRLVAAYQAGEFAAMQVAARESLDARPDYPNGIFNLALAQTLAGENDAALASLERLTDLRVDLGVDTNEAFAALHKLPGWDALAERVRALRDPVGGAERAWQLEDGEFVPEGIAINDGKLYLGSIRKGGILVTRDDRTEVLVPSGHGSTSSVFGMRIRGDKLWFVTALTDQFVGDDDARAGSELCSVNLAEGGMFCTRAPRRLDGWHTLGDLVIDNDDIYTADQTDGPVYRFDVEQGRWSTLVEKGEFVSPQGLVLDATAQHLYVADYRGGIYRVRLDGYAAPRRLRSEASLYGIDGLYRHKDWLIAVQNGITPHRISAHRLSDDGLSVTESRILLMNHPDFDEPNLGTIANDAFYVIANSHWNRFDRDNNLPEGLSGPIILKLALPDD